MATAPLRQLQRFHPRVTGREGLGRVACPLRTRFNVPSGSENTPAFGPSKALAELEAIRPLLLGAYSTHIRNLDK